MKKLKGRRTYIVSAAIVLTGVAAFVSGEVTAQQALVQVLEGLGLATLRMGVAAK